MSNSNNSNNSNNNDQNEHKLNLNSGSPRGNREPGTWNDSPLPAYDDLKVRLPQIEYWKERAKELEEARRNLGEEYIQRQKGAFDQAIDYFNERISVFYSRFADLNNITYAEAQEFLSDPQLARFHMELETYIELGESMNIDFDEDIWQELEEASIRYRVTRLEALKMELKAKLEELYTDVTDNTYECLAEQYRSAYYRSTFNIFQGFGVGVDFMHLDNTAISLMLADSWRSDGSDFSDRIWYNKRLLMEEVPKQLTQSVIRGEGYQVTAERLAKALDKSRFQCEVLVRTESAFFSTQGEMEAYNELGIEEYQNVATLDNRTTEICQDMDGTHFKVTDAIPWETCPPFNYQCRTVTVPLTSAESRIPGYLETETRAARNKEGKTYYVGAGLNYHEWAKTDDAQIPEDYEKKFRARHQPMLIKNKP